MTTFLDLAVKSTLLLGCAAVVALATRRASAASRHLVWTGAFCAVLLLPIARFTLPALRIPVFAPPMSVVAPASITEPINWPVGPPIASAIAPISASTQHGTAPIATPRPPLTLSEMILAIWLFGVLALVARNVASRLALRRVVKAAEAVTDAAVLARLEQAAINFRVRRPIKALSHAGDGVPCTFGTLHPVILLPASPYLDSVLIHEVAHIARLDAVADRIAQAVTTLYWFNPLMWIASRVARNERERAADDAVLANGARASDYASDLVSMARSHSLRFASSTLPMAASGLERRVRAILDDCVRRGRRSSLSVAVAAVLMLAMLPVSAARLVARAAESQNDSGNRFRESIPGMVRAQSQPKQDVVALQQTPAPPPPKPPVTLEVLPGVDGRGHAFFFFNQDTVPSSVVYERRVAMVEQVLKRAQAAWKDALTKVEIGTSAQIDVRIFETTIAEMERALLAAQQATWPSLTTTEWASVAARFDVAMRNLNTAQVRFDNGLLTNNDLADALKAALAAATAAPAVPADQMFTAGNFRTSMTTDPNNARALYELLTGRVTSINGNQPTPPPASTPAPPVLADDALLDALRRAPKIASETERADALIQIAQRYPLTPDMVAAYVAAANSITSEADKARVFAQSIRVKSAGKGPEWYWQRKN